jgi:protein SCO1/2
MMAIRLLVTSLLFVFPALAGATDSVQLPQLERVTVIAAPKTIADFELTDQNGNPRKLATLRGAPTLVFFGFTRCPDICPTTLTKLKVLLGSNGGALKGARVVLISVDGERDTPAVIKKYLASFSPDFVGMTGKPRAVSDIAARFSAVAYKEQPDPNGNYGYFHSSQVFVLDKEGRLRASFNNASVENMATITRLLLDEPSGGTKP